MSTTLLQMTQDILSAMDSDEVNSVNDSIEALQVATLIKKQYEAIVERYELPAVKDTFKLEGLGDTNNPTSMRFPDACQSIEWIGYNIKREPADADNYQRIQYLPPGDFMDLVSSRLSTNSNTETVNLPSGVVIYVLNDKPPQFYTTFEDRTVVMDSYSNTIDTTLQGSKTNCFGERNSTLIIDDATVIPLPQYIVNLLYNEALEMAFNLWKEGAPIRIQQDAVRTRVRSQRLKNRLREQQEVITNTGPDYGRKGPWR